MVIKWSLHAKVIAWKVVTIRALLDAMNPFRLPLFIKNRDCRININNVQQACRGRDFSTCFSGLFGALERKMPCTKSEYKANPRVTH